MGIMRRGLRVLAVGVAAIGCASPIPPPTTSPTPVPTGLAHFESDSAAYDYPASWKQQNSRRALGSHALLFVHLAPFDLPDPCIQLANGGTSCGIWPRDPLPDNSVVMSWVHWDFFGEEPDPSFGPAVDVGGRTGYRNEDPPDEGCAHIGGLREIIVRVWFEEAPYNWEDFSACFSGPDATTNVNAFDALLGSFTYTR